MLYVFESITIPLKPQTLFILVLWMTEYVSVGLKKFKNGDFSLFDYIKSGETLMTC